MPTVLTPLPAVAPVEYRKNGWHYRQLRRVGNFAIYSQGGGAAFEVVHIRVKPACLFKGKPVPEREYLPSDSEWGRYGWTLHTLAEAEAKVATLTLADKQNAKLTPQSPECGPSQREPANTK